LVGVAVGYTIEVVDVAVASPSALIPRFQFESAEDTSELDSEIAYGFIVNRIDVSGAEWVTHKIHLIPDPIMESVVHLVTPYHIISICTNSARIASHKAAAKGVDSKRTKTTAWSCLDVSFFQGKQNPVIGAVVSGDVQLGHVLIARLSNGKMIAINLTERRHRLEMDSTTENPSAQLLAIRDGNGSGAPSETEQQVMRSLQQTESLADIVQPMIKQVYSGISKMAQVGGSSTTQDKISLDIMAGALSIQERCQKEVFLPIIEMNQYVTARRSELKETVQKQEKAVKALHSLIEKLREKRSVIQEKTEIVTKNAKSLADRSASVLQSANELLPTITQAEYDYFRELKRLDAKSSEWKSESERLKMKAENICDSMDPSTTGGPLDLPTDTMTQMQAMLRGLNSVLANSKAKLESLEEQVDQLAVLVGYVAEPDVPLQTKQ